MTLHMMILIISGIQIILLFPPIYKALLGLENISDYLVGFTRYFLWLLIVLIFYLHWSNIIYFSPYYYFSIFVIFFFSVEILLRTFIKYSDRKLLSKRQILENIKRKIINYGSYGVFVPKLEPHPFLHFTLHRKDIGNGNAEMGFENITLKDIPKPSGTIRVACLGNSTTVFYPYLLEEFLNKACPQKRFQALNFGMGWWSSLHTTVNFVLNVIDFNPDYVVLHENCNDHNYRGYPGLRGDGVHAYLPLTIPWTQDIFWSRLFVIYRIFAVLVKRKYPTFLRRHYSMERSILKPDKKFHYNPRELYIFERNLETIFSVAKHRNIRLCLMTHPFSNILNYGEEHDKVYRPHMTTVNNILRKNAAKDGSLLIDADRFITGEEELFIDPVHVSEKGNMIKSYLIGREILRDLDMPMQIEGDWKEIELWTKEKSNTLNSVSNLK